MLEEEDDDESARSWNDLCSTMRGEAPEFFEDALNNIQLDTEAAATGYRWQLTVMSNEGKFFEALGKANAAQVRDYLCANRESLAYTRRAGSEVAHHRPRGQQAAVGGTEALRRDARDDQAHRRGIHRHRALVTEQIRYVGQFPLLAAEKLSGTAADLAGLPDGVGEAAEKTAQWLREKNQAWLENNRTLRGRAANYRALVQAEKGGVLPLFKETREQVYDYWDRNKSSVRATGCRSSGRSLENEWVTACPTYGQQDDAKDFYKAAFERVEHTSRRSSRWRRSSRTSGTASSRARSRRKPSMSCSTRHAWRMNAETLVNIRTPAVIDGLLDKMDGYYEESFAAPLEKLKDKAEDLSGERKKRRCARWTWCASAWRNPFARASSVPERSGRLTQVV